MAIVSLVGLTSTLIVLGLEFTTADHYGWDLKEYARHLNIGSFLVPIVLVGVVVFGLLGLLGHLRWAIPLALMVGGLMLTVNLLKLRFRDQPLYPSDFAYIGETDLLVSSVGIWPALILVGVVLGVGIFTWLIVMGLGKLLRIPPANRSDHPRWVLAFRVLTVAAAAVLMVLAVGFNAEGNPLKRLFERKRRRLDRLEPERQLQGQRLLRRLPVQHAQRADGQTRGLRPRDGARGRRTLCRAGT